MLSRHIANEFWPQKTEQKLCECSYLVYALSIVEAGALGAILPNYAVVHIQVAEVTAPTGIAHAFVSENLKEKWIGMYLQDQNQARRLNVIWLASNKLRRGRLDIWSIE